MPRVCPSTSSRPGYAHEALAGAWSSAPRPGRPAGQASGASASRDINLARHPIFGTGFHREQMFGMLGCHPSVTKVYGFVSCAAVLR